MSAYSRDEALAFVEAIRANLTGKTGFRWFVERLTQLEGYIKELDSENMALNEYVDSIGARDDFEAHRSGEQG